MYSVTLWVRALRISNEPAGARRDEGHAVQARDVQYHPGPQQVALTRVPDEP